MLTVLLLATLSTPSVEPVETTASTRSSEAPATATLRATMTLGPAVLVPSWTALLDKDFVRLSEYQRAERQRRRDTSRVSIDPNAIGHAWIPALVDLETLVPLELLDCP